jgi:hypothetical protein
VHFSQDCRLHSSGGPAGPAVSDVSLVPSACCHDSMQKPVQALGDRPGWQNAQDSSRPKTARCGFCGRSPGEVLSRLTEARLALGRLAPAQALLAAHATAYPGVSRRHESIRCVRLSYCASLSAIFPVPSPGTGLNRAPIDPPLKPAPAQPMPTRAGGWAATRPRLAPCKPHPCALIHLARSAIFSHSSLQAVICGGRLLVACGPRTLSGQADIG